MKSAVNAYVYVYVAIVILLAAMLCASWIVETDLVGAGSVFNEYDHYVGMGEKQ